MAGEDQEKQGESRGFAGLSSLVSDVDMTLLPPDKQAASGSGALSSAKPPTASENTQPRPQPTPNTQPRPQLTHEHPVQEPSKPTTGMSTGKWMLGIAAVVGVLWFIGAANKEPSSTATSYSPSARNTAPSYSAAPAQPHVSSRLEEVQPPVGQNLVLSTAQIIYCLAEDIRIDSASTVVNNNSDFDVNRFNSMVTDYNSRCASFRYKTGALESARRKIDPYRSQIQAEGRNRFAQSSFPGPSSASVFAPSSAPASAPTAAPAPVQSPGPALASSRHAPDAMVQVIQRKLNELGYNAGIPDGVMGKRTRSAIMAFQQDKGVAATGVANQALLLWLETLSP